MVLLTFAVVAARYLFHAGSIATQELVMYLHGSVFMLGIAYTLKEKGHVRVDVLYENFSEKTKAIVEIFGTILFLIPISLVILLVSIDYVQFAWNVREASADPGGLQGVFLLKTLIPIMAILLGLQGLSESLKAIIRFNST